MGREETEREVQRWGQVQGGWGQVQGGNGRQVQGETGPGKETAGRRQRQQQHRGRQSQSEKDPELTQHLDFEGRVREAPEPAPPRPHPSSRRCSELPLPSCAELLTAGAVGTLKRDFREQGMGVLESGVAGGRQGEGFSRSRWLWRILAASCPWTNW